VNKRFDDTWYSVRIPSLTACLQSLSVLLFCLLVNPSVHAQTKKITAAEAKGHVDDRRQDEPPVVNLDEPYSPQSFIDLCATIVQITPNLIVVID
jgi:hypothetical protein